MNNNGNGTLNGHHNGHAQKVEPKLSNWTDRKYKEFLGTPATGKKAQTLVDGLRAYHEWLLANEANMPRRIEQKLGTAGFLASVRMVNLSGGSCEHINQKVDEYYQELGAAGSGNHGNWSRNGGRGID